MEEFSEDQIKFMSIFYPHHYKRIQEEKKKNTKFVHYTRAESALSIIKSKKVWMRKPQCMNDFMEVEYGLRCLVQAWEASGIKSVLNEIFPDIDKQIERDFNDNFFLIRQNTFIFSVSEHKSEENKNGRLSMWRAYGGNSGVAIVMNNKPFFSPDGDIGATTNVVNYSNENDVLNNLLMIKDNISTNIDYIKKIGEDTFVKDLFRVLSSIVLCTKHEGFSEELEWRVIYNNVFDENKHISERVVTIAGIPQVICEIPLQDIPEANFFGASIPDLLDHIIIGPSVYGDVLLDAFVKALEDAGVQNPLSKIQVSKIPLRQNA